ncbi:golgin subfamily A member 4 isoform X2 [Hemitrygon akajei]|uniref:golgin subfamily A member 4 isoform X2 n=1 Tax=Hemitrygon akajei TaxID=2704970 RepID=UPI003BFA025A
MFKKLKQKINEEQSPAKSGQITPRSTPSAGNRIHDSPLSGQSNEDTFTPGDKELLAEMITEPAFLSEYTIFALESIKRLKPLNINVNAQKALPDHSSSPKGIDNLNGDGSAAVQKTEMQSFAQKLQLRVPSMESLFRASSKESLFSSPSKDSLVRTASRESLNRIDLDVQSSGAIFDPSSDIESETEDNAGTFESLSKDPSSNQFRRIERSLANYRSKYSELVTAYRTLQRDKEKMQVVLSQGQDKALRRIGELREELQMIQQAKKHIQDEFEAALEEKDQFIGVLQTQVTLLKQRIVPGGSSADVHEPTAQASVEESTETAQQSSSTEDSTDDPDGLGEGIGNDANSIPVLQKRVKRQENLLQRCKEMIHVHKERCTQMTNEKEALQEQLDERYQELEKIKDLHTAEKTKLITQLRDAKNLIEQLEQDKGMVIAETKRQMHETLEMKEEEISQLRTRIQQFSGQREDLLEQKEKSDRAAFEELEKALAAAQKSEDKYRRLKEEMEKRISAVEEAGEEERKNLQQELRRVKQEAVNIMKKSSEDHIGELEKSHMEALACKEREFEQQLLASRQEFQEQLKTALDKCHAEYREQQQEKEQQTLLALEEQELQREAIRTQAEKQMQELQGELETCKTRVLELESLLVQKSQNSEMNSEELEAEKVKYKEEMEALIEKQQISLKIKSQEEEQIWLEKLHQEQAKVVELEEKCGELEAQLKEKETQFHAHIEEMNQKTLEKLDLKQTELELLSTEMTEILKVRQELENKLSSVEEDLEKKLKQKEIDYNDKIEVARKDGEQSICVVEKNFTEKLNSLHHLLEEKDKNIEELQTENEQLTTELEKIQREAAVFSAELEIVSQARKCEQETAKEKMTCELGDQCQRYEAQLTEIQNLLRNMETEKLNLNKQLEEKELSYQIRLNEVTANLENYKLQAQEFRSFEEKNNELIQKIASLTEQYESRITQLGLDIVQMQESSEEKQRALNQALSNKKQQAEEVSRQRADEHKQHEHQVALLHEEYGEKIRTLETKLGKMKESRKGMQEKFKLQLSELEIKLKAELKEKQEELIEKEQMFNTKMVELAQSSSTGINETVAQLESSQKQQLESLNEIHKKEVAELNESWVNRLDRHVEELKEKYEVEIQEKEQEFTKMKVCLKASNDDKDKLSRKVEELTEEIASTGNKMQQVQEELKEASSQVSSLMENEIILKTRLETLEENTSQNLRERTELENELSELKKTHEQSQRKIHEQNCLLKESEDKLQLLENLRCKEHEKALQENSVELQNEFGNQIKQLINCFNETGGKIDLQTNKLSLFCFDKISNLNERITVYQNQIEKVKKALERKICQNDDLETHVQELVNQNVLLNDSVQHITQQLQNKEQNFQELQSELQGISAERDTLQQDSKFSNQVLEEKEAIIEQYKTELAANANTCISITEQLKEKESIILSLEKDVQNLKLQLEHSVCLADKEEALSLLNKQHQVEQQKLLDQISQLSVSVEAISQEKTSALGQVDQYKHKLTEWKKKTESKFAQHNSKMKELELNFEMSVKENEEKDGKLLALTTEIEKLSNNFENLRIEMEHAENEKEKLVDELKAQLQATKSRIIEMEEDTAMKSQQSEITEVTKQLQQKEMELQEMKQQLEQAQTAASEQCIKFKEAKEKNERFEEEIESLRVEFSGKQTEWEQSRLDLKNKDEELRDLETKLKTESVAKIAEFKKKAEQKIAKIRKQLINQMEEKEKCMDEQLRDLKQKAEVQDATNEVLEEKVKTLEATVVSEKEEKQKLVDEVKKEMQLEKENFLKVLRESYEEKIMALQTELSARDGMMQKYKEVSVKTDDSEEVTKSHLNVQKHLEIVEVEGEMKTEQLQPEIEQQKHMYDSLCEKQQEKTDKLNNLMLQLSIKDKQIIEMEERIAELETGKEVTEKDMIELEDGLTLKQDIGNKARLEGTSLTEGYRKEIKALQEQLQEKISLLKIFEEGSEEKSKSDLELLKLLDDLRAQQTEMGCKLEEAENEKQKLRKEHTRLQKDLRVLRKEHEAEIEIIRKEIIEEAEKTSKLELEDLQLKHNSTLKQLMREFNTQLAQKEQELDISVKEAISKAQEVEAELLETHKEDINQLYRKIADKDDYLQRTVKRYEEILQTREEEMTVKVNDLQLQLEELQAKCKLCEEGNRNTEEGHLHTVTELKAQLAQKTTLLSDAKLQEQEFREQIHSLEDQLGVHEKSSCLSPFRISDRDGNYAVDGSVITEPTEIEYLKKVLYEYMMGKETKTLAKVITTVLKFPSDQTQKILEREESRSSTSWLR